VYRLVDANHAKYRIAVLIYRSITFPLEQLKQKVNTANDILI